MKQLARLFSGALVGAALLFIGLGVSPGRALASGPGFCDETDHFICCCSTNPDGSINDCTCMPKDQG